MARARNIKPSFFIDEDLVELSFSTRLLFIGLWTLADREGRLPDKPKSIKMSVFPCDRVDVNKGLDELQSAGLLTRYVVDSKGYIEIRNFAKHQRPHPNEAASEFPAKPPISTIGGSTREMSEPIRSSLNSESYSLNDEVAPEPPLLEIFLGKILAGVMKELGLKTKRGIGSEKDWVEQGTIAFENGFTAEQFLECYTHLRAQRSYKILPKYVMDSLPDFARKKKPVERLPTYEEKMADDAANRAAMRPPPRPVSVETVQ